MQQFISLIFSLTLLQGQSQSITNRPVENDSTLNTFQLVQKEIKTKEIGTFEYNYYFDDGSIHSKISIQNFYATKDGVTIWTILAKYEYNKNGQLTNRSFWKANNIDKACACNVWYEKVKPMSYMTIYHPRCKKIKLNCDSNGRHATK